LLLLLIGQAIHLPAVSGCPPSSASIGGCAQWNNDYYNYNSNCNGGRAATASDAQNQGIWNAYGSWCNANSGSGYGEYINRNLQPDLACVFQLSTYVNDIHSQSLQSVLVDQTVTNKLNQSVPYTFQLSTTFTNAQTYSVTQASSFSISDTLTFSVSEAGFSLGNSITVTKGITNTYQSSQTFTTEVDISETPTITLKPYQCIHASILGNVSKLVGDINVPSQLSGPISCDYGSSRCGHYEFYATMNCESTAIVYTSVGLLADYQVLFSDCTTGATLISLPVKSLNRDVELLKAAPVRQEPMLKGTM